MNYIIIGAVIVIGFLIYSFMPKSTGKSNESYVPKYNTERTLTTNDKLIIIENAEFETVKQVVIAFTRSYDNPQQKGLKPISKLYKLDNSKIAVTFPYDIDFEILCYYVNYLKYPVDIIYEPKVLAWTSTKSAYQWLDENFENNKVIMFIDSNDAEYDNVMITTEDGKAYKLGFAVGDGLQKEPVVIQKYEQPSLNLTQLDQKESVEIR